jgi:ATP-dependent protease HslVU (ClpYQ) peptidase subunit
VRLSLRVGRQADRVTVIVGVVEDGQALLGADSVGSDGWNLMNRTDPKVFVNGEFVMGFTTSYRMGQLLRYAFTPPARHADKDLMAYMVTDFIDALRGCLKSGGWAEKNNENEKGGVFLVGHAGRLFRIEADYQVGESADGCDAVGCGDAYAKGALYATKGQPAAQRIRAALAAAETYSSGVRGPFHFVCQPKRQEQCDAPREQAPAQG